MTVAEHVAPRRRPRAERPPANRFGSTAERLNWLFENFPGPDGRPYSAERVAEWVKANGDIEIAASHINKIRIGYRARPSAEVLRELARFFRQKIDFFTERRPGDPDPLAAVEVLLQDDKVRAAVDIIRDDEKALARILNISRLSRRARDGLDEIIKGILAAEGKLPANPAAADADTLRAPDLTSLPD